MWSVVLKILSILGIILLALLGLALAALLLVLLVPVVYRGSADAHAGEYRAALRFRWLFGLARGELFYPGARKAPQVRLKVLWLTLYDSEKKQREEEAEKPVSPAKALEDEEKPGELLPDKAEVADKLRAEAEEAKPSPDIPEEADAGQAAGSAASAEPCQDTDTANAEKSSQNPDPADTEGIFDKLAALRRRLQPYLAMARDEDNQALVKHVLERLGRLLKGIRPRVLRLEALVGTGEPDTTGYIYGAYWTVKPFLGRKCRIAVTPDFERQILEGEVFLRGHIIGVSLLYQALRVILDKRLWQLVERLKEAGNEA